MALKYINSKIFKKNPTSSLTANTGRYCLCCSILFLMAKSLTAVVFPCMWSANLCPDRKSVSSSSPSFTSSWKPHYLSISKVNCMYVCILTCSIMILLSGFPVLSLIVRNSLTANQTLSWIQYHAWELKQNQSIKNSMKDVFCIIESYLEMLKYMNIYHINMH